MLKNMVSFITFSAILTICLTGTFDFLENKYSREKYDPFFNNYKNTNYDVIWMGTSHTYNSILSQELWNNTGITSYNFGSNSCTIPIDYYILQHVCNYTKPKLVAIDLYGLTEYEESGNGKYNKDALDQCRVQFDSMPLSKIKIDAVKDIFDDQENNWDFLFNFAIYHNRWKEIGKDNFSPRDIPQNGSAFVLGLKGSDYKEHESNEKVEINSVCSQYIPKIVDFCEKNNIELVFMYLPYTANENIISVASSFEDYIKQFPSCKYINMLNKGIINYKTDLFTDASHLNYIGASKVTKWIGDYLINEYPELVHTDKETCDFWNEGYEKYVDYKISRFEEKNLINNILLSYGNDFYIKLYSTAQIEDDDLKNLIEDMNINVIKVPEIIWNDNNCSIKLEVYLAKNDSLIYEEGYK